MNKPSDLQPGQQHLLKEAVTLLSQMAYHNAFDHGFWGDYYNSLNVMEVSFSLAMKYKTDVKLSKIALMHSELGEMTEGVRKPHADEHCPEFTSEEIELADAFIRGFDYAAAFNLRLGEAILAKMEYNASRPHMHGKGA